MNWILSFFSNEAHVAYIVGKLGSVRNSIIKAEQRLIDEATQLEQEKADFLAECAKEASDISDRQDLISRAKTSLASFL